MILNRFYIQVILRVILLTVTCLFFTWSWTNLRHLFTFITLGALLIIQVILLINYFNRINRDLNRFFITLKSGDLTTRFSPSLKKSIRDSLQEIVHELLQSIEHVKIEKESHYQYLRHVVEHMDVGLLSFENNGKVDLLNRTFRNMLNVPVIKNIRYLNAIHPDFEQILKNIQSGGHKLIMVQAGDNILHLILRATAFNLQGNEIKLVSIQNIQTELDEKELASWQKLIRVLTHEIMNSVSPISSLATTLSRIFMHKNETVEISALSKTQVEDTARGLEIIGSRSKGLLQFVKQYRKINLLPKPQFTSVSVSKLFSAIQTMYKKNLAQKKISLQSRISPGELTLKADEQMIEQVLINLLNNSIDALKNVHNPSIILNAYTNKDREFIFQITDNGAGIPEEIRESVFVPFFTTKESGSGIGLSLARQIMHLHGGTISLKTSAKKGTMFNLLFKESYVE